MLVNLTEYPGLAGVVGLCSTFCDVCFPAELVISLDWPMSIAA